MQTLHVLLTRPRVLTRCPDTDSELKVEMCFDYLWPLALRLTADLFLLNVRLTSGQQHLLSVHDGKLVSLRIFPLMHFNRPHLSIGRAMQSLAADFVSLCSGRVPLQSGATSQTDQQLSAEIFSCVETYLSRGTIGSQQWQQILVPFMMSDVPIPSRQARSYWLQTVPTVTWTPAMACYSKHYYKFDNISNNCQKSANINSS